MLYLINECVLSLKAYEFLVVLVEEMNPYDSS
jgi:hypothetical protein